MVLSDLQSSMFQIIPSTPVGCRTRAISLSAVILENLVLREQRCKLMSSTHSPVESLSHKSEARPRSYEPSYLSYNNSRKTAIFQLGQILCCPIDNSNPSQLLLDELLSHGIMGLDGGGFELLWPRR